MRAVLGIDAAWAAHNPSGVALVVDEGEGWRCVRVAHSFGAFVHAARKGDASFADVLKHARALVGGSALDVTAVDMPMSRNAITGRRASDRAVSKLLTRYGCPAMPPQPANEKTLTRVSVTGRRLWSFAAHIV